MFLHAGTVALNHEEIKWGPPKISKFKSSIKKYNWDGIKYPSKLDDRKTFEKNNPTTTLNVLYTKELKTYPAFVSKQNSAHEKQITLLMIPNKEK